jgi:hypothetical protein
VDDDGVEDAADAMGLGDIAGTGSEAAGGVVAAHAATRAGRSSEAREGMDRTVQGDEIG